MAERAGTHFKIARLNLWFAGSSLLLLLSVAWMIWDDFDRPWKVHQREFREVELRRANERLAREDALLVLGEEERLLEELARARAGVEDHRAELAAAEEALRGLEGAQFEAGEAEKEAKQILGWERFQLERRRNEERDASWGAEHIEEVEREWLARVGDKERADRAVLEQERKIADLTSGVTAVEAELEAATRSIEQARQTRERLAPADASSRIANVIRDAVPGLDFIDPEIEVRKVVLEGITFELNFLRKKRIDMCMSCHVPIDRAGYTETELEEPLRSHPRLDLFLSDHSPHPLNEVGCTICHRGAGEALDFQRADHRPSDEVEAARWVEKHGWHKERYWDYPMLESGFIEASCVQCHEESLELIADEAPLLAEGYRLFERYGCYACHEVEWFPTDRRPGPSLARIRQKTSREFVDSWISDPTGYRPDTLMPQVFLLENYPADETVVVADYGAGEAVRGGEWNQTAIAAISSFVWSRAREDELPEVPVPGDPVRGREVFRLSGCLACHTLAPHGEEERARVQADLHADSALKLVGTSEFGPSLRGVAAKVSPEWLFAWLRDPAALWSETRMPDLRLSAQDAADVVAYLVGDPEGVFHDVPDGWRPADVPFDPTALREQARWLYSRLGRDELDRRFHEEWADPETLLEAVGEKLAVHQGCHSCHEIQGLEDEAKIGTELTTWGSNNVDRLDWGSLPEIIADERHLDGAERHAFVQLFESYRENFILRKLDSPRAFDRRMARSPAEKLRMPWYRLTDGQARALSTFVLGLVEDEVPGARMPPTAALLELDRGSRALRQRNCAACHVLEPGTVTFVAAGGEPGERRTVQARFLPFEDERMPPSMADFHDHVADHVEWMREEDDEYELEGATIQLLRGEPGLGIAGTNVFIEDVVGISATPPVGGDFVDLVTDYYLNPWGYDEGSDAITSLTADPEGEGRVEDVDGRWRAYDEEPYEQVRTAFAPPALTDAGEKLQREWLFRYLVDPVVLRPQMRVRMPTFNWATGEAGSVTDYFARAAERAWPGRYARELLLARDLDAASAAAALAEQGMAGASPEAIRSFLDGERAAAGSVMDGLLAYGAATGFLMAPAVDPRHEVVPPRQPGVLDPLLEARPTLFDDVHLLVVDGPDCLRCHLLAGEPPTLETPLAWAPDLFLTRERLRPDWTRTLLIDPAKVYPGTTMPTNFPPDDVAWQDLLPADSPEQIDAVLAWLYNLDRALAGD